MLLIASPEEVSSNSNFQGIGLRDLNGMPVDGSNGINGSHHVTDEDQEETRTMYVIQPSPNTAFVPDVHTPTGRA